MGNVIGSSKLESATMAAGKVVLSDGRVQNLKEETTVAEIMLENPQHVVVEFDPSSISFNSRHKKNNSGKTVKKKLTPLPANKTLEIGKIYLVLPAAKRIGGAAAKSSAVLTSEEIRKMVFSATAMVRSSFSYYEGILPWFTTKGYTNNTNNNDLAADAVVAATSVGRLEAEMEEERPEFLSRQLSGRGWKPSLDPIKEKKIRKKIHQRLLF
ncbi:unnamed protein product [Cochlearia groenlandica]